MTWIRRKDDAATGKQPVTLRQRALRALARREYSRVELAQKLRGSSIGGSIGGSGGKGAGGDESIEIDTLLDEFETSGWLSDERFAGGAARQRQGRFSQRHIVAGLKARGVAVETAQSAVAALEQDDETTAIALWRQRFGVAPANQKEKARQVRFLQSRGFSLSVALKILKQAGTAADDGEEARDER